MPETTREPIFIVGTGRCGSTALSQVVRTNDRWLSLSEVFSAAYPNTFPAGEVDGAVFAALLCEPRYDTRILLPGGLDDPEFLYPVDDPEARFSRETGVPPLLISALPHLVGVGDDLLDEISEHAGSFEPAPVDTQYRRLFEWLRERFGAERWIERSGSSLEYAGRLVEAFPDARFVHLWRDGLECTLSMSRHTGFRLTVLREQMFRKFGVDPFETDERPHGLVDSEYAPLLPERFDPELFAAYPLPLAKFAGIWSRQLLHGLPHLLSLPPDRILHLGYAELVRDPIRTIGRFQAFVEGEIDDGWVGRAAALIRPPRPSLGVESVDRRTRQICEAGMKILRDAGL